MHIPQFTAENSIYKTSGHYQTARHANKLPTSIGRALRPAMARGETIEIFDCRPGFIGIGEGEGMICIPNPSWAGRGHGDSSPAPKPSTEPPQPSGPIRFPVDDGGGTKNMDRACNKAGANCFPISTANARCAVLRCRKDYCTSKDPKTGNPINCTADEIVSGKEAKSEYKGAQCDMFPCLARPSSLSL